MGKFFKAVLASSNKHKAQELKAIFDGMYPGRVEILTLEDINFKGEIEENGKTFEENAMIKAKAVFDFCRLPVIADDSGLEVYALNFAPGIYSARFSEAQTGVNGDAANRALLLKMLAGETDRGARFVCVAAYVDENRTITARGECEGIILERERGEGGFGYDSLFLYPPMDKTFAEIPEEEKNKVSHRYRAFSKLICVL